MEKASENIATLDIFVAHEEEWKRCVGVEFFLVSSCTTLVILSIDDKMGIL